MDHVLPEPPQLKPPLVETTVDTDQQSKGQKLISGMMKRLQMRKAIQDALPQSLKKKLKETTTRAQELSPPKLKDHSKMPRHLKYQRRFEGYGGGEAQMRKQLALPQHMYQRGKPTVMMGENEKVATEGSDILIGPIKKKTDLNLQILRES